ncbi:DUF3231 family protein [Heyndrickxia oleronia]|nr:DUF3231 family protein [Heyndrickxia oleronia]MBU5215005.1 DUF3231 family protein [Heyndrickxia oleronia]MCM3457298.1 DUF3231 family protein [Heyndrickxia oleronia]MEC1376903.1 DUF3231 family protein [Heyndrickxia oleronia]QQZ03744.1 DUF3231 family protein [Heyndrickxia oleronia]
MTIDKDLNPMNVIKPLNINPKILYEPQPFTTFEIGKLWATYMGNSMSIQILSYFLQNCDDEDIRLLLENGLALANDFTHRIEGFFKKENFPIPIGFTKDDVNLGAPRLYADEFYVHYLKYAAKAGLSLYAVAVPLVLREDIREFFIYCNQCTTVILGQTNNILMDKKFIAAPPTIPTPDGVDKIDKQSYLSGFIGEVRPLQALEIIHLWDNIENNVTSLALLLGFHQIVQDKKIKALFKRGLDMTNKAVKQYQEKLHVEHLQSPSYLDHLITTSTFSPFSDKIMLFHKVDMFAMKIRSFGNSLAVTARRDINLLYLRTLMNIGLFVDDGMNILIDKGWLEAPPEAYDRS